MSEQLELGITNDAPTDADPVRKLTDRQQLAYEYVRDHDGVTADEVGAFLHAHKDRRPHSVDVRCDYCARDGIGVLKSKAVAPLVTYRRAPGGNLYVARDPADRPKPEQTGAGTIACSHELDPSDPFYGL